MKRIVQWLIRGYQVVLSPYFGGQCRFFPSCSVYALEAVGRHGTIRGLWLSLRRVLKCHPLHPGGVDLVPETRCRISGDCHE